MVAEVIAGLTKYDIILKPELRNIKLDNNFQVFMDSNSNAACFDWYNCLSFKTINKASTKFDLKSKMLYIFIGKKTNLNAHQNHLALTPSL